jgi:hypothetical protein
MTTRRSKTVRSALAKLTVTGTLTLSSEPLRVTAGILNSNKVSGSVSSSVLVGESHDGSPNAIKITNDASAAAVRR